MIVLSSLTVVLLVGALVYQARAHSQERRELYQRIQAPERAIVAYDQGEQQPELEAERPRDMPQYAAIGEISPAEIEMESIDG